MEIALAIIICLNSIICFITGAKVGQKVVKGEPVEMPNLNLIKAANNAITEHKENKQKQKEDEYYKAILQNIDNYDGTGVGQVKIPIRK